MSFTSVYLISPGDAIHPKASEMEHHLLLVGSEEKYRGFNLSKNILLNDLHSKRW
jgi:hypothetical protein